MPTILAFITVGRILEAMETHKATLSTVASTTSAQNLFTCARGAWIVNGTDATVYLDEVAQGQTLFDATTQIAGTSEPAEAVQPAFYPVATKFAECAAIVSDMQWADKNLNKGYEFMTLAVDATTRLGVTFFVSGVLNSTQTQANDPFGSEGVAQGLTTGACWAGAYSPGQNPYA